MSTPGSNIAPAGEEIHLPGPTIVPLLVTVGLTGVVVGVATSLYLVIAGALLTVAAIVRWVQDTRRDIAELPLEHHH